VLRTTAIRFSEVTTDMRHFLILAITFLATGCLGEPGPKRFRVSGEITFDGKPVPFGEVLFTPDSGKGNSGPQGIALIQDGKYDTAGTRAHGVAGGATVVQVAALSDSSGKLLCEYQFTIDLPKADSTQKIEIPAAAAKKKGSAPEI
jgi:hypothetical protein